MVPTALVQTAFRITGSGLVPLLLVLGLLMAPVTCTCGSSIPHGHSLFQIPHHHHAEADEAHDDLHEGHQASQRDLAAFTHQPHPPTSGDPECDRLQIEAMFAGNFALSNMMEQQDGAVLKAPPSSSTGQPMAMSQPSTVATPTTQECEPIELPATRTLEGLETSPETPPPRA